MTKLPRATFKEETGDMQALISCKSHSWNYTRLLYDLGQKDRNTDLVRPFPPCELQTEQANITSRPH